RRDVQMLPHRVPQQSRVENLKAARSSSFQGSGSTIELRLQAGKQFLLKHGRDHVQFCEMVGRIGQALRGKGILVVGVTVARPTLQTAQKTTVELSLETVNVSTGSVLEYQKTTSRLLKNHSQSTAGRVSGCRMRGDDQQQDGMFSYISPNKRVPQEPPMR